MESDQGGSKQDGEQVQGREAIQSILPSNLLGLSSPSLLTLGLQRKQGKQSGLFTWVGSRINIGRVPNPKPAGKDRFMVAGLNNKVTWLSLSPTLLSFSFCVQKLKSPVSAGRILVIIASYTGALEIAEWKWDCIPSASFMIKKD